MPQRRSLADGRPPLAVSPRRLRPRRNASTSVVAAAAQSTPPRSRVLIIERSPSPVKTTPVWGEFQVINSDLMAMAKMAKAQLGSPHDLTAALTSSISTVAADSPQFQRGRFYDAYAKRRNERLKRKKMEVVDDTMAIAQDPCVAVELGKQQRRARLQAEAASGRKSVPTNFSAVRTSGSRLRSSLCSSKEMKKAAATCVSSLEYSAPNVGTTRRMSTRSSVRRL